MDTRSVLVSTAPRVTMMSLAIRGYTFEEGDADKYNQNIIIRTPRR